MRTFIKAETWFTKYPKYVDYVLRLSVNHLLADMNVFVHSILYITATDYCR